MTQSIRPATAADAPACAAILNDWIDATPWMPRLHTPENVTAHYRDTVLSLRQVRVIGDPVVAYIAIDPEEAFITALYVATSARGRGQGGRLLDDAKATHPRLRLWTFEANTDAHRFYEAHGFSLLDRSDGDNEESLPDRLYGWDRP